MIWEVWPRKPKGVKRVKKGKLQLPWFARRESYRLTVWRGPTGTYAKVFNSEKPSKDSPHWAWKVDEDGKDRPTWIGGGIPGRKAQWYRLKRA